MMIFGKMKRKENFVEALHGKPEFKRPELWLKIGLITIMSHQSLVISWCQMTPTVVFIFLAVGPN